MFRYVYEADGQRTIIRCSSVPPQTSLYWSLAAASCDPCLSPVIRLQSMVQAIVVALNSQLS